MFKHALHVIAFVFLFACAQIGAVSHEISHFSDIVKHDQQDKDAQHQECTQCISYAEVMGGLPTYAFNFLVDRCQLFLHSDYQGNFQSQLSTHYSARAPPQFS